GQAPLLRSHTGREARFESALVDESGRLYIATDIGLGIVHTLDMETAADAIEQGHWATADSTSTELPQRFGHCLSPQAQATAT
ncbi:MAG TPA: DUF2946 family protein, partial [Rhizobacter sp.]|nr:DUF2946 family protein [Rhizobacter sp.]